ncbi:hypothetical protein CMI37_04910 [Candidatus Pacearchaeota archaeon]|nr:hypothetical protein [Candidatus Pacearchaeota archaeon]
MSNKTITEIDSQSELGTKYNIVLGEDYRIYCTCPAWRFSKTPNGIKECKHLRALFDVSQSGNGIMLDLNRTTNKATDRGVFIRKVLLD